MLLQRIARANSASVAFNRADQDAAAFVRVGLFAVAADGSVIGGRNLQHGGEPQIPPRTKVLVGMTKIKGDLDAGLKRLCRDRVSPLRGSPFVPPTRGLTPAANTNVAAARLVRSQFRLFVPPRNSVSGCDTVSKGQLYPITDARRPAELRRRLGRRAGTSTCSARSTTSPDPAKTRSQHCSARRTA